VIPRTSFPLMSGGLESAAQATALIIALMIDPDAVAAHAQQDEVPAVDPEPPVVAATSKDPRSARPMEIAAGAHSQASLGTLPDVDVGVGVGLGLSGQRWRVDLRGSYGVRRNQPGYLPSTPGAYGQFNITTVAVVGCHRLGPDEVSFGPCAVLEGGMVSVEGHGASTGFSKRAPWIAVGAGAYLSLAMGRHLFGGVEVELMFPLYRPEYVYQDLPGVAFQAPALGGRALLGMGWRF
jgi:hypothetical protein